MNSLLGRLQPLGRALMLPIAVLPVAGLLLRLGQPDLLNIAFISAAGNAIFAHLGLLFAIGVATGFARDGNGAACLAGVTCFVVATEAGKALVALPPEATAGLAGAAVDLAGARWRDDAMARLDVPVGILSGLVGGQFYNRFATIRLPEYLAFFGGRRFVPIASGVAGLGLAAVIGGGFAGIAAAIDGLSRLVAGTGLAGLFAFGVLNRLLLVTGLHHILNNILWFVVGDYHGAHGDLRRFFAGDPAAGLFMAGFFPVMMFGLPAACLAMYHAARPERRAEVGGMLFSLALTAALTGVTEPIEFSFMFLAPALYALHAVLTGLSMVVTTVLGIRLGFGFSAGLLDYVLNYGKATRPLLLLPVGVVYFLLYYGLFSVFIRRFDLPTPGREPDTGAVPDAAPVPASERGTAFVAALGGAANLASVGACTTRLRLVLHDPARVDEARLKVLGARGTIRPSASALQVVLGPIADVVAAEMQTAAAGAGSGVAIPIARTAPPALAPALAAAAGGIDNVADRSLHAGRLRLVLADPARIDMAALDRLGARLIARPAPTVVHLLADDALLAILTG